MVAKFFGTIAKKKEVILLCTTTLRTGGGKTATSKSLPVLDTCVERWELSNGVDVLSFACLRTTY
jgi:hypothetical protein